MAKAITKRTPAKKAAAPRKRAKPLPDAPDITNNLQQELAKATSPLATIGTWATKALSSVIKVSPWVALGLLVFIVIDKCRNKSSAYVPPKEITDSLTAVARYKARGDSLEALQDTLRTATTTAIELATEAEAETQEIRTRYTDLLNTSQSYLSTRKQKSDETKQDIRRGTLDELNALRDRLLIRSRKAEPNR